ncbi:MAG: IPT/TIG domain-containing protein [Candidatus Poribacteria bacterium]|nr:IPT/TIG domain-containing protein [Candidatus Poribacteria bacterium]
MISRHPNAALLSRFIVSCAVFAVTLAGCDSTPQLDRIEPSSGPETGGFTLEVHGKRFRDDTSVTLNGAAMAETQSVNGNLLRVAMPTRAPGEVVIGVLNPPDKPSAATATFAYVDATPPALIGMEPAGTLPRDATVRRIRATFSESLESGEFLLSDDAQQSYQGAISIDGVVLVFTPDSPLPNGRSYIIELREMSDAHGNVAEPFKVRFSIAE